MFTHFSRKGEEKEEGGQRKWEGERTKNAETENQREAEGRLKADSWVENKLSRQNLFLRQRSGKPTIENPRAVIEFDTQAVIRKTHNRPPQVFPGKPAFEQLSSPRPQLSPQELSDSISQAERCSLTNWRKLMAGWPVSF